MLSVTPDNKDFSTNFTTILSHLCLSGWPTSAITWNKQEELHRRHVCEEFEKRYKWHPMDVSKIRDIFRTKTNDRVKDQMSKSREFAKEKAANAYPGDSPENHMHEFNPPWVENHIWVEMCQKWKDLKWLKISEQAAKNKAKNAPEGAKPMGTYIGGSISQSRHAQRMDRYNQLMDEKYQSDIERPQREFNEELWEKASEVKNNYVKALGMKKTKCFPWGRSTSSSQSSSDDFNFTSAAEFVRIVCANPSLLSEFSEGLRSLNDAQFG